MAESAFDKRVRAIFPKDHHIVLASLAGWAGLYVFGKMTSFMLFGGKKKAAEPATPAAPAAPSVMSGGFAMPTEDNIGEWAEKESNWADLDKHLK
mmetsp:Transcript_4049/g.10467  ORF Transcript_4049/g.10467 Transcript_4049/m.10467 type:complete len:95 (-) Transcript_4049:332-616(-)|eukprot:CAMPEP_0119411326 /NCGR_PEP_ID=MMETSP1335-20130426/4099_1 /TAXON_ID=259385 /ORGANISM="Chrysoculter rhomboideus, Strain RCC1486" /LENGTH=94 /DNA_ID=CAMNT_0007435951 /DNA_START=63 /DNA_END=347 /DNA_ORIENTATION=+